MNINEYKRLSTTTELKYVLPSTSDHATREFRRWWVKSGMASAPAGTFGPATHSLQAISRAKQLNRFEMHTKHCKHCLKALARFRRVRDLTPWVALIVVGLQPPRLCTLFVLCGLLKVRQLSEAIVQELGGFEPSELPPRSVAATE